MTSIAVALQTCERADLTARTINSFLAHNARDLSRFVLLHGDDASEDASIGLMARAAGFRTVVQTRERCGIWAVRQKLLKKAAARAKWILLLENDIETLRPFPWDLFDFVTRHPAVYCLRLYGRFKDAERLDPCLMTHKRNGHQYVRWKAFRNAPEKSQIGVIHWSAQPCVTRAPELLAHHHDGLEPVGYTVRVKRNVTAHIGAVRTPGRVL